MADDQEPIRILPTEKDYRVLVEAQATEMADERLRGVILTRELFAAKAEIDKLKALTADTEQSESEVK